MAFQIGLPILIFLEKGVIADGILEKGVVGTYMPEFHLDRLIDNYFKSDEWKKLIGKWEGLVRRVPYNKGLPPELYQYELLIKALLKLIQYKAIA
ncbi:hypothetical protein [Clostridium felsineum]|uniref:hypothetical protein n=1 Tax=Clostridium felsineum TaxID=36839 RepID=UPI00098CB870|nr:hypothetical protein [Clostridium felsineum]URZ14081.1 hypothetical protein CLFE_000560 [Clostridium felsineum DSM 794]